MLAWFLLLWFTVQAFVEAAMTPSTLTTPVVYDNTLGSNPCC